MAAGPVCLLLKSRRSSFVCEPSQRGTAVRVPQCVLCANLATLRGHCSRLGASLKKYILQYTVKNKDFLTTELIYTCADRSTARRIFQLLFGGIDNFFKLASTRPPRGMTTPPKHQLF
eukprot:2041373-Prymnesium_polylepis.1